MIMDTKYDKPQTRRGFLDLIIALCSAVTAAAMGIPSLLYLWPAAQGGGAERVEVVGADRIAPGQGTVIQVGSKVVVVVRHRDGYKAFSAACTHLGCLVEWDPPNKRFICPCHAAVFDENGQVVSGPPPAPLPEFHVKEIGGKVYVSAA
jgi:cytochrome b6-f complex iron-sulfur subunit